MKDPKICKEVLECLLQHPVGELKNVVREREIQCTSDGKPIRLDICTEDDTTVYDAEMQNLNHKTIESLELPKRCRFYQSAIDNDHMDRKYNYKDLPDSIILFICTFDPFKKGLGLYTFTTRCDEDSSIGLGDGTKKIFYNCCYGGEDLPEELRQFYRYIETGKAGNKMTEHLNDAVFRARREGELRSSYLKEMVWLADERRDARKEGFDEGYDEGYNEGYEKAQAQTEAERKRADDAEARVKELDAQLNALKKA